MKIPYKSAAVIGFLCAILLLCNGCQAPMAIGTLESIGRLLAHQLIVELVEAGVFADDSELETDDGKGYKKL